MNKRTLVLSMIGVLVLLSVILAVTLVSGFNKGVTLRNDSENKRANIAIALELRLDKLEALLEALNGLEDHVEDQLKKITEAREKITSSTADVMALETDAIETGFKAIVVLIEDNPNTYIATNAYMNYMAEISASTNMIASTKLQYNDSVNAFNTFLQSFPRNLYLPAMGFSKLPLYEPTNPLS